jgi:hypothetical protein
MLYLAFVRNKPRAVLDNTEIMAKSRHWWNEGGRPAGLKTLAFYGTLSTETPDVYVFEAESHEDVRKLIDNWKEVDFDIHPALDFAEMFRKQGMKVA